MKKSILDEEALAERKNKRKQERMLDVHPKPRYDSRKWTALAILLIIALVCCVGYILTR